MRQPSYDGFVRVEVFAFFCFQETLEFTYRTSLVIAKNKIFNNCKFKCKNWKEKRYTGNGYLHFMWIHQPMNMSYAGKNGININSECPDHWRHHHRLKVWRKLVHSPCRSLSKNVILSSTVGKIYGKIVILMIKWCSVRCQICSFIVVLWRYWVTELGCHLSEA